MVSASAWRWAARSCATRRSSAWTSRCPTSTRRCGSQTRTDIAKLQADLGVTTVYVTHDQVEAMTMGDRVAVMKDGYLQQVDTPLKLYDKPVNLFVAGFIGSPQMNLLEATRQGGQGRRSASTSCRSTRPRRSSWAPGTTTSPSASAPRPGAWCRESEGGLPVARDRGRGARRRRFVYGTSDVEGTPNNIIVRVSRPRHRAQGRHALRHDRPASTCTSSTPTRASASPTDPSITLTRR